MTYKLSGMLLGVWQRFDALHYLRIAASGYATTSLSVFYPLFPALVRLTAPALGGNLLAAAFLISNLACLLLLIVFYRLMVAEGMAQATAQRALLYLVFAPVGVFLLVPYTESLFLLLSLASFHAARRGRWGWAALAGFAAALTRLQGVVLTLVLGWEILEQAGRSLARLKWRGLLALTPMLGAALFMAARAWAGYPPIGEVLQTVWHRYAAVPGYGLVLAVGRIVQGQAYPMEYLDLFYALLMLGLGIWVLRRLPLSYTCYLWGMLLLNLSQFQQGDPLSGQSRYALALFPAFIGLAELGRSPARHRLMVYASMALWLFSAGVYVMGGFVG